MQAILEYVPLCQSSAAILHAGNFLVNTGRVYQGLNEKCWRVNTHYAFPLSFGYTTIGRAFIHGPYLELTNTILEGDDGPIFQVSMHTSDDVDIQTVTKPVLFLTRKSWRRC